MESLTVTQYIQKRINGISFVLAFGAVYSMTYALRVRPEYQVLSNSFVSVIITLGLFFIIRLALGVVDKRKLIFCGIMGLLFSMFLVVGAELALNNHLSLHFGGIARKLVAVVSFSPAVTAVLLLLVSYMPGAYERLVHSPAEVKLSYVISSLGYGKYFCIAMASVMLFWLLAFFAYYPGIFCYDAPAQLYHVVSGTLTTHHPLVHTWFLYFCLRAGHALGSDNLGLAVYTVLQMLLVSAAAGYALLFLRKMKLPAIFQLIALAFFALSPVNALLSVSATKDIIFSAFSLFLFIFIIDIYLDDETFFHSLWRRSRFVLMVCLMALFRNNGIYAFFLCMPFLILFLKKHRIQMTLICLISIVLFYAASGWLVSVSNAGLGSSREAMSVPIQQLARVYAEKGGTLSDEEREAIITLIPTAERYEPHTSDPTKNSFNDEAFSENGSDYIKLWAKLGLRYPDVYITAFLMNNMGLWYTDMEYPNVHPYLETLFPDNDVMEIKQSPIIPALQGLYTPITKYTLHQNFPLSFLLFSPATPTWVLLFAIGACFYYKKHIYLSPLLFLFGLWCTVALAPVVLLRYVFPFYIAMPVMIGLLFNMSREK